MLLAAVSTKTYTKFVIA